MDNYLIPPAPRPISTPNSTPAEEKSQYFPGKIDSAEHYILFPSNTPVYPPSPMLSEINFPAFNDYSNFKLKTIDESKETEGIQLQPIKIQKKEIIYSEISIRNDKTCSSFKPKVNNFHQVDLSGGKNEQCNDLSSTNFNNDFNKQQQDEHD